VSYALVTDLARNAVIVAMLLAAPLLLVALLVGLVISILQTMLRCRSRRFRSCPS
jgi:flagellar biosynthetic protein FliQ